jgi:hypothetical protein
MSKSIQSYTYEELTEDLEVADDPNQHAANVMTALYNKILDFYREQNDYPEGRVEVDPRKIVMDEKEIMDIINSICDEYDDSTASIGARLMWMNQGPSGREVEGVERGQILLLDGYMTPEEVDNNADV